MTGARKPGPRSIGACWDIADKNIRHYKERRDQARREGDQSTEANCQRMLDKWLEYRHGTRQGEEAIL